ncbi:patatin-like phospholipase family protein [Myxococcota bacterium]|nr:patatin-like phospholipase family protein [Myxococcota bacterium]
MREQPSKRPRIGVALGGGAARGWAHLGVIRALREEGIDPWCVAGTSIGSFIGAAWISGSLDRLTREVLALNLRRLLPFFRVHLARAGLIDGRSLEPLIRQFVTAERFEDLPRRFGLNATDLRLGEEVPIREGDLLSGILASTAVPGLFSPVERDGRLLVDGGLVNPVPVSLAREMGAEVVVAVDINHHVVRDGPWQHHGEATQVPGEDSVPAESGDDGDPDRKAPWPEWMRRWLPSTRNSGSDSPGPKRPGLHEVLWMGIAIGEVAIGDLRMQIDRPEVLIRPRVGHIPFLDFSRGGEAIDAGYEAAREILGDPAVRARLGLAPREDFRVPSDP